MSQDKPVSASLTSLIELNEHENSQPDSHSKMHNDGPTSQTDKSAPLRYIIN